MSKTVLATLAAGLLPATATAHPEHLGDASFALAHFATDPFHVALCAAAVALALVARLSLRARATAKIGRR